MYTISCQTSSTVMGKMDMLDKLISSRQSKAVFAGYSGFSN
jgi:hypothetical protein